MPNDIAADPGLPCDNRSPTRFFDNIHSLAHMASITYMMIEEAHCCTRALKRNGDIYTFQFSQSWIADIKFATADVTARAAALAARGAVFASEEE